MDTQVLKFPVAVIAITFVTCIFAQEEIVPFATMPEVTILGKQMGASRMYSKRDIATSGARTVGEFLSRQASVTMRDDQASGGKQFARINGSNVNQVMVLVDGVRISDVGSGESDLARIPLEWIESIEVSSGGSAEFGAESIGGVISIHTTAGRQNGLAISAVGSETLRSYGAKQEWSKTHSRASLGVFRSEGPGDYRYRVTEEDGNGPLTPNLGQTFERINNELVRDQLLGKFQHDLGHHTIGVSAWLDRSEFGLPGYLAPRPTPLATQREHFRQAQLDWSAPTFAGVMSATAAVQDQERDFSDPDPYSYLHESHEATKRWTGAANIGRHLVGISFEASSRVERESIASGVFENDRATRNRWQISGLVSKSKRVGGNPENRMDLQAGLNCERFGDESLQFLPNGNVSYSGKLHLPFSIGVGGSKAYLAPGFYSLFWNDELLAQGNPDLRPESSSLLFGFARVESESKFKTSFEFRANRNRVEDLIYWRQAFDGRWTPQNLKRASIDNLTCTMHQELWPGFASCHASVEWLEARDRSGERTTNGKYLIYRPARTIQGGVDARWQGFTGNIQARWNGRQAVLETNSKWLPEFTVIDADVKKSFIWRDNVIEVGARCENILDSDYRMIRHAPMPLRQFWIHASIKTGV